MLQVTELRAHEPFAGRMGTSKWWVAGGCGLGESWLERRPGKDLEYLTEGPVPWTVGTEHRDNEKMSLQEVWSGRCAQEFQPHLWDVPQVGCAEGGDDGGRWADQQGCFPVFWPKG